ncbi:hypothetical protein ABZU92_24395 [Micromonospora arida]|uniref:hypothetical protein n=1 Tax=Micromonospora arida TaxID=2203715 RepID=UPI0033A4E49C
MAGTRAALIQLCQEVAVRLVEAPPEDAPGRADKGVSLRDEASRWCAVLPQIEAVRSAAKAARAAQAAEQGTATGGT